MFLILSCKTAENVLNQLLWQLPDNALIKHARFHDVTFGLNFFLFFINHNILRAEIISLISWKIIQRCTYRTAVSNFHMLFPKCLVAVCIPGLRISCSWNSLAGWAGTIREHEAGVPKTAVFFEPALQLQPCIWTRSLKEKQICREGAAGSLQCFHIEHKWRRGEQDCK